jgi:medium-chain acyl-[acyl-carrier-protein] hydrolase
VSTTDQRVLARVRPRDDAGWRLLCVPPAGAGVGSFAGWAAATPPDCELLAVRLAGRETRLGEPAPGSITAAADELAAVCGRLDGPYVLLGHSMGALIAYETVRRLPAEQQPRRLVVSGHDAPHHPADTRLRLHELPRAELVAALRHLGGTPEEVLAHEELLDLLLPTLRADLGSVADYVWTPGPPLDVSIAALWARDDLTVHADGMRAWAELTTAATQCVEHEGGHFALLDDPALALAAVAAPDLPDLS